MGLLIGMATGVVLVAVIYTITMEMSDEGDSDQVVNKDWKMGLDIGDKVTVLDSLKVYTITDRYDYSKKFAIEVVNKKTGKFSDYQSVPPKLLKKVND